MESEEDFRNLYPTAIGVLNLTIKTPGTSPLLYSRKTSEDMFTKNLKGRLKTRFATWWFFLGLSKINKWEKRGSFTLPKGTLGFALRAWQLSFSSFLRSYSQPVSGVMIEFHILELYLATRLVYLLGLITVLAWVERGGRKRLGGRYKETVHS